jgi:hypothetical protein
MAPLMTIQQVADILQMSVRNAGRPPPRLPSIRLVADTGANTDTR